MVGSVVGGPVGAPEVLGGSEGATEDVGATEVDGASDTDGAALSSSPRAVIMATNSTRSLIIAVMVYLCSECVLCFGGIGVIQGFLVF